MINFLLTTKALVKGYDLKIDNSDIKAVYIMLSKNIDILIFNVITIAAIISFINNSREIQKEAVKLVKSYIKETCSKYIKGGTSLPSDYFGDINPIYSENNISTINYSNVDFENGILRPQIGGGGYRKYKITKTEVNEIIDKIKNICKHYNLKISSNIIKMLLEIIIENMECLFNYLKSVKKPITTNIIKKMIKINKNFEIFK